MTQNLQDRRSAFFRLIFLSWLLIATEAACVRLPRYTASLPAQDASLAARPETQSATFININTATPAELEKLPGIGEALAARIVEHRQKYGRFRRVEHLLMVRGISERRFKQMRALLTTE